MNELYQIDRKINDEYFQCYYYKTKNLAGQTLLCELFRTNEPGMIFNFSFCIKRKRKDEFPHGQITGKDGLKSLIWAYNCLKDSISFMQWRYKGATLMVIGEDIRRRKIYERYLIPLGFKFQYNKDHALILKF